MYKKRVDYHTHPYILPDTKDWKNAAKGLYVAHDRAARVELCRHLIIGKQLASVAALVCKFHG